MFPTFYISGPASGLSLEGYADLGCASSAVFEPANDIAGLRVGDLMVWQFNILPGSWTGTDNCMGIPSGWTPFCTPKYKANAEGEYSYAVLYRRATSDDLSISTSYTVTFPRSGGYACSRVTTHRNAHSEYPFGAMVYDNFNSIDKTRFVPSPYPGEDEVTHVLWAAVFHAASGLMPAVPTLTTQVGPNAAMTHYYDSMVNWTGSFDMAYRMGAGGLTAYDDENWIPNENSDSCLAAAGWTGTGVGTVSRGGTGSQYAVFSGSGASSTRHYWEYEVTLEAGEKYTFFFATQRSSWNFANGDMSTGISYVDPSAVERGAIHTDGNFTAYLDPSADRLTTWHVELFSGGASSVPSNYSAMVALYFTAGAAGTYKLRVNGIEGGTTNWTFVSSTNEQWKVSCVNFRKGWRAPWPVQTGDSPVYVGSTPTEKVCPFIGWLSCSDTDGNNRIFRCFSVVASTKDEFSGVSPRGCLSAWAPMASLRKYGYYDRLAYGVFGGSRDYGDVGVIACRTPVYPTYGGVRKKYYVEFTALETGKNWALCLHTPAAAADNAGRNIFFDAANDAAYDALGASTAISASVGVGDKIGAMVDFTTAGQVTITIYNNGVSAYSSTVTTGAATQWPEDEPWQFTLTCATTTGALATTNFSANTTGPFSYKPVGAVAWAAANEVA